ncbi:MAG: hypothetical protein ACI8P9_002082 [Parasphingorhabdus sp.]|jgi:hypothetical protein
MAQLGNIRKMRTGHKFPVQYELPLGEHILSMNSLIGSNITIRYSGKIHCVECGRRTNKSFSQGYCYPCFRSLAACDRCIMSPELCHYDQGTCRQPEWADEHCMQPHIVYLANSSGIKVGITRGDQVPVRWMDQGAMQALPIFRVGNRYQSGLLEVVIKKYVTDRTDWRKMLKNCVEPVDLKAWWSNLKESNPEILLELEQASTQAEVIPLDNESVYEFSYPVEVNPEKIKTFNLDKTPEVSGLLQGIKGQYLMLDGGVINIRKYGGYEVSIESA